MAPRSPAATQLQRHRRADADSDGEGVAQGTASSSRADIKKWAAEVVRLALFSEYKRQPLRREMIIKQVFPNAGKLFVPVFAEAQEILRKTFGMELHELRVRHKLGAAAMATQAVTQRKGKGRARDDDDDEESDEEEDGEDGAVATQRARKAAGSKAYILRSTLPAPLVAAMARAHPLPNLAHVAPDVVTADSGALVPWEKADAATGGHVGLLGIRAVILAVVLCSGRVIQDDALHAYLRRFNLEADTVLPYTSSDSHEPPLTLDKYLDALARQNYLEKIKIPGAHGESASVEWRWGSREAEFSEKAAAAFIEQLMMADEADDAEEDHARRAQNQDDTRAARRKRLRTNIEKAATGGAAGGLAGAL
ncbi:hypothetical protein Q5752_003944 [Cryptotrichosporon argae]